MLKLKKEKSLINKNKQQKEFLIIFQKSANAAKFGR